VIAAEGGATTMRDVVVAGAAMTRFGKFMDSTIRSLAEEATFQALADGNTPPSDVGMAFFANATAGILTGQEMIRGQVALRHTGLLGIPIVNVENACASASSAFSLACMAVGSGAVDVALAVGAEKMTHPDKAKSFGAIGTAVDLLQLDDLRRRMQERSPDAEGVQGSPIPSEADAAAGGKRSFFMDIYAANTKAYMDRSGARVKDFAQVAVKNHHHGALNPKAQYRDEVTVEDVLASREISWPLTLLMCSPIGDGAAAVVVCTDEYARRAGIDPLRVRASVLVSGTDRARGESGAVERAAARAYEQAGIGPDDLDVVELHDAAAPAELMTYEELGFCAPGDGSRLLASGDTALGGRMPVNTSGGLLSKGHPIGATGCGQIVELVDQLRGRAGSRQVDGARVALAENGGGFLGADAAAMVVTILSK
jgi:acetyl-CoA acyltransferase